MLAEQNSLPNTNKLQTVSKNLVYAYYTKFFCYTCFNGYFSVKYFCDNKNKSS